MTRGTNDGKLGGDVVATLREMWETRPARPRRDKKVAGVAAAVARRYDIDPVLVRVGFVVAAVYGIGVALYLAGWLLLPAADPDDPLDGAATPAAPRSSGSRPGGLGLVLLVVALAGCGLVWLHGGGSWILPLLATFALLYLLHRSRGDRATAAGPAPVEDGVVGGPDEPGAVRDPLGPDPYDRGTPPAWDPLGAAPFAWDLPEPSPPEPEAPAPRRRRSVTPLSLLAALVAGVITAVVAVQYPGPLGLGLVFAVPLAVVGLGMLIGAFAGGGRGLIPFALVLAALTWLASPAEPILRAGVHDVSATPATVAEVQSAYDTGAGSVQLDLSRLNLALPDGAPAEPLVVRSTIGLGDITVTVPANADVTVRAHTDAGDLRFGSLQRSGTNVDLTAVDDLGADGVRSGRPIELDLRGTLASVEVRRG